MQAGKVFTGSTLVILTHGSQVTNVVFLGTPPPVGYGFTQIEIAGAYATPIVGAKLYK